MDHLQRGALIHEILQQFMTATKDDPPSIAARDRHLAMLREISDAAGDERVRRGVAGLPLVWKQDKRIIDEDLVRWYDREMHFIAQTGLLPGAFEARFGPPGPGYGEEDPDLSSDEPLELVVNRRTIRVQGRIDRIDWDEKRERFRVIDYKTGKARARQKDVFAQGTMLQLAVYLRAAAHLLDIDERDGEAQYFYATSAGEFKRHVLAGAHLSDLTQEFEQILDTIASGVDDGYFAPNPLENKFNCKWCDYADVCDVKIDRIMQRKAGDERGAAFIALGEIE